MRLSTQPTRLRILKLILLVRVSWERVDGRKRTRINFKSLPRYVSPIILAKNGSHPKPGSFTGVRWNVPRVDSIHVYSQCMFHDNSLTPAFYGLLSQAKYAYRSIANFVKHVTGNSQERLRQCPFPELDVATPSEDTDTTSQHQDAATEQPLPNELQEPHHLTPPAALTPNSSSGVQLYRENTEKLQTELKSKAESAKNEVRLESKTLDDGKVMITMLRERVDVSGHVRPMEPEDDVEILQLPPQQIGLIKEDPVRRWQTGQDLWDKKFKRSAAKVESRRRHFEEKASKIIERAREQGFVLRSEVGSGFARRSSTTSRTSARSTGQVVEERRWGKRCFFPYREK